MLTSCAAWATDGKGENLVGSAMSGLVANVVAPVMGSFASILLTAVLLKLRKKLGIETDAKRDAQIAALAEIAVQAAAEKAGAACNGGNGKRVGREEAQHGRGRPCRYVPKLTPSRPIKLSTAGPRADTGPRGDGGGGVRSAGDREVRQRGPKGPLSFWGYYLRPATALSSSSVILATESGATLSNMSRPFLIIFSGAGGEGAGL